MMTMMMMMMMMTRTTLRTQNCIKFVIVTTSYMLPVIKYANFTCIHTDINPLNTELNPICQ